MIQRPRELRSTASLTLGCFVLLILLGKLLEINLGKVQLSTAPVSVVGGVFLAAGIALRFASWALLLPVLVLLVCTTQLQPEPLLAILVLSVSILYRAGIALVVCRLCPRYSWLSQFRDFLWYLLLAVVSAPLVINGLLAVVLITFDRTVDFWEAWRNLFLADAVAHLLIPPALAGLASAPIPCTKDKRPRVWEAGLLVACLLVGGWLILGSSWPTSARPALSYSPLLLVLWTAVRFGPGATGLSFLWLAWLAIWNS